MMNMDKIHIDLDQRFPNWGARVLSRGCTGQGFVLIISRPYCNDKSDQ